MAFQIPEWLNKPFFEAALQGGEEKELKIFVKDFSTGLAVASGNNYTSNILRVMVRYKTEKSREESITLIVKAPYAYLQLDKEPIMYSSVLPKLEEKINHRFTPKSYFSTQKDVLVIQDLGEAGYAMCDKFLQLDYAHCELVMKTIAKFHAASVALHNEMPREIENLGVEALFVDGSHFTEMMKPLLAVSLGVVTDTLKKNKDDPVIKFLALNCEKLFESLKVTCKPKKKSLNVLNHGDLWNCNMLFKHTDDGKVVDVKFIDYQSVRYMTPAIDILYFTWTSADEEVRENHLHQLYDVYLKTLNDSLEQLGYEERYTSEQLLEDMKSSIDFVLATTMLNFPFMLAEPEDAFDMTDFDLNEFLKLANSGVIHPNILKIFNGKQFRAKVPKIIEQFYKLLNLQ